MLIPSAMNKASHNQFIMSTLVYLAFGASSERGCNAIRIDGDLQVFDYALAFYRSLHEFIWNCNLFSVLNYPELLVGI